MTLVKRLNFLGRRARHRAHRPGRGPARRHQVARDLRGAGGHRAAAGARGAGAPDAVEAADPHEGAHRPGVRRPDLQRPLVHRVPPGPRRVRPEQPASRDRRGADATAQGPGRRRRTALARRASTTSRLPPTTRATSTTRARRSASSRSGGCRSASRPRPSSWRSPANRCASPARKSSTRADTPAEERYGTIIGKSVIADARWMRCRGRCPVGPLTSTGARKRA